VHHSPSDAVLFLKPIVHLDSHTHHTLLLEERKRKSSLEESTQPAHPKFRP
jgi:hypothetical protein